MLSAAQRAYGSLAEPDYSFVQVTYGAQPCADLVARLSRAFDLEETTASTTT